MIDPNRLKSIKLIFEDEDIVVVNKPSNMAVHGGASLDRKGTLFGILQQLSPTKLYPVHRLDKATSGLVVLAKNADSVKKLGQTWEQSEKVYYAWVFGKSEPKTITLDIDGQSAKTEIIGTRRMYDRANISELEIKLWTGRTHQIRRHLTAENLAVVMDDKYGDFRNNKAFRRQMKALGISISKKTLFLHAGRLRIASRQTEFTCDVPELWRECATKLGSQAGNL
ncbi:MAG: RluA family pseudouridine synthase [Myxococcota bacterium]|nr:RluA family pseudouridine synthase [Myxococcota bacterium]